MIRMISLAFALLFLISAPALAAQDKAGDATRTVLERVFSEGERAIIEEYFGIKPNKAKTEDCDHGHKGKNKTKGKNRHSHEKCKDHDKHKMKGDKALPPGLQKHLEKHGRLPPGLEGRDLPPGLAKRLPAAPKGTVRKIVGNDLVLIDETKQIVLDVVRDVLDQALPRPNGGYND